MLRTFLTNLFSKKAASAAAHERGSDQDWLHRIDEAAASDDKSALDVLCNEVASTSPRDNRVWQRLGRLKAQAGDVAAAEILLQHALAMDSSSADVLCDLANVRQLCGDTVGALGHYERALAYNPKHELSLYNAAFLYLRQSETTKAFSLLEHLFTLNPHAPGVAEQLATIFLSRGDNERGLLYLVAARESAPVNAMVHAVLGATYAKLGKLDLAAASYRRSLELDSSDAAVANNLGYLFLKLGRIADAIGWLEKAVELKQGFPEALNNLAIAYQRNFDFDKAEQSLQRAMQQRPGYADAHSNMGKLCLEQGRQHEAESHFRQATTLNPAHHSLHSNLLLCLNYSDHISRDDVYRAHVEWAQHLGPASTTPPRPSTSADRSRKLRVAYVSPDFVTHSVAFFIEPILREHDSPGFEIYCYSNNPVADRTTERLKSLSVKWRDIYALTDTEAADLIRCDRIDILVDLSGHTSGNRLPLMNEKPAPIQVTYLGYPNTTGMRQIDYRITDDRADDASAQNYHTETLVRLQRCFLCYQPPPNSLVLDPISSMRQRGIGFCAFNNLAKVTDEILAAWVAILSNVPESVLYLPGATVKTEGARRRWLQRFEQAHVDSERIVWIDRAQSVESHLDRYRLADIALDTYPYSGTTTSMDALWMGVPVVTMYGGSHASRVTYDLLSRIGLERFAATSLVEYVDIAVRLARHGPRDSAERNSLRRTLATSELMNAKDMAASLEQAYRDMWGRYQA